MGSGPPAYRNRTGAVGLGRVGRPGPGRRPRAATSSSGSPFSSTARRPGATPLAASTRAADGRRGQHQVGRGQQGGQGLAAVAAPVLVHLAGAHAGLDHQRARSHLAVDQELAGAHPPEVVHGHHHPGPGRPGRRQQPGAQGLQRVEVDHLGRDAPAGGPGSRRSRPGCASCARRPTRSRAWRRSSARPGPSRRSRPRRSSGCRSPSQPAYTDDWWPRSARARARRWGCSVPPLVKFGG